VADRRFEILEIPGAGAHATVCLARDLESEGQQVALKVLRREFDPKSTEAKRARDEAVLLGVLDHPNIVKLHERLAVASREVLVMEWVVGAPLGLLVRRLGRLPPQVSLEIVRHAANAAYYAYNLDYGGKPLRLVHRDLNLSNILLSIHGEVKILDYGLAKAEFDEREASTHVVLQGTAGYVAPEGLDDQPSLDVYALGVCLFFMLTGHLPVLSRQRMAHAAGLSEQLSWLHTELERAGIDPAPYEALIRGMCAHQTSDRLDMAGVLAAIGALQPEPEDLIVWADTHVHPLHMARPRVSDVREHPSFPELAFLLEGSAATAETDELCPQDEALREFLRQPDWSSRPAELKQILVEHPRWTAGPLLEVLASANRPWWKLFGPRPPVEATRLALRALAHRPSEAVTRCARGFCKHRDPAVRELARAIVEGRDVTLSEY